MNRKIGEEFDVKIRVRTVENINGLSCTICALRGVCHSDCNSDSYEQKIRACYPVNRTDGKNVYYELVTYEEL